MMLPADDESASPLSVNHSYTIGTGGSKSNTSRATVSPEGHDPSAWSFPNGSKSTPSVSHWAGHSKRHGSFPSRKVAVPSWPQPSMVSSPACTSSQT
jgi:hypothetical protein